MDHDAGMSEAVEMEYTGNIEGECDQYEIGAIQEEDEEHAALQDEEPVAVVAPPTVRVEERATNMRPLVTMAGEMSDWMECVNSEGDTYYLNVVTNETSWSPPFEILLPPVSDRLSSRNGSDTLLSGYSTETANGDEVATRQIVKRVMDGSIRRLDPHTQMQLEEARRRHKELEELRDQEVLMGGEHWVEMYDPTHDGFYYYGTHSGEMRWDRPNSYVMNVSHDDVLRLVVRMQCAFRIKLARRKVFQMKLQRGLIPGVVKDSTNPWVEVYDPFHKVLYYYCSSTGETRWDPPDHFISASEDREMAAAIAIQSMTRSHVARRDVKKRKTTIRKKQHEQAIEETKKLRDLRRKDYAAKTDNERESICRRELLEEEMEQIRDGDSFWGIDKYDQEVVRQYMEEKLLADAEAFWQRVDLTLRLRCEQEMQRSHEDETHRKETEKIDTANECDRMRAAEADQCQLGDCFWGIQAEERREEKARVDMDAEQTLSRLFGCAVNVENQHLAWAEEREKTIETAKTNKILEETRNQKQYFKWFYHQCQTADDMLDYLWPNDQRYVPPPPVSTVESNQEDQEDTLQIGVDSMPPQLEKNDLQSSPTKSKGVAVSPPRESPYILDDIVLQHRMETEYRYGAKSIYTIHDPSSARAQGRRGQYVISVIDTEPVFAAAAKQADCKPRSTSPTRPMPQSSKMIPNDTESDEDERIKYGMFPALHHRRGAQADPHLPARYNGVPYRSSEITNANDEILHGHHTKLTQLPSLPTHGHHHSHLSPSPKKKHSQSTIKPSPKKKHSSFFLALQETNNNASVDPLTSSLGFASPFYKEAQATRHSRNKHQRHESEEECTTREAHEKAQRTRRQFARQFEREELGVVREVFEIMDCDDSGTINKKETVWALQRDGEVHALAKQSALLRLLLKQPSHLDELFNHLRMSDGTNHDEISWDIFCIFCEEMYISLMQQGILTSSSATAVATTQAATKKVTGNQPPSIHQNQALVTRTKKGSVFVEANEEQLIRRVFSLCDQDGNGMLEVDELQHALYTSPIAELQKLVGASKALQPLLHQDEFIDAFRQFEPMDPRGICEEEFVGFCLEIAQLALFNGML